MNILIIFTFNPILSLKIENMIIGYDNIDIVNEKILRQWIGNEIIIPCRIGSLARIRYGGFVLYTFLSIMNHFCNERYRCHCIYWQ